MVIRRSIAFTQRPAPLKLAAFFYNILTYSFSISAWQQSALVSSVTAISNLGRRMFNSRNTTYSAPCLPMALQAHEVCSYLLARGVPSNEPNLWRQSCQTQARARRKQTNGRKVFLAPVAYSGVANKEEEMKRIKTNECIEVWKVRGPIPPFCYSRHKFPTLSRRTGSMIVISMTKRNVVRACRDTKRGTLGPFTIATK